MLLFRALSRDNEARHFQPNFTGLLLDLNLDIRFLTVTIQRFSLVTF